MEMIKTNKVKGNELINFLLAEDYMNENFGIGEELQSWIEHRKEELEVNNFPYFMENDKLRLIRHLEKCIEQLKNNNGTDEQ